MWDRLLTVHRDRRNLETLKHATETRFNAAKMYESHSA